MNYFRRRIVFYSLWSVAVALLSGAIVRAGVTVTGGVAPGATSWAGTPIVASVSNPSGQSTVAEGFSSPATSYAQTFTVPIASSYALDRICLYVGGGTGTSGSAPLTINLYDLGGQAPPNPSGYTASSNLLGGGAGLPISYTTQANGVLQLDFTDADRVVLVAGRLYAFEISGVSGTNPMTWLRGVADNYAGGAAYRNGSWINGNSARDFALAVYGTPVATPPTSSTINAAITRQTIDGFGAGTVFLDAGIEQMTDPQMDALYGTGLNQMGLTLMRVRISPNGSGDWSLPIANGQKAVQRGAKILATPWTPPAAMKDNGSTIHGSLLPAQYQNFVDYLNSFIDAMASNGAPVSVVSLQNEPDFDPDYEGCQWTAAQFQTFCRDFADGIKASVMMPESYGYNQTVSDLTLNDPTAASHVAYIGGHLYGATIRDYPLAHSLGKPTWMTEYLVNDQTIGTAVATGQQMIDCLTTGNMSAYIWWKTIGNANGLLNAAGVLQPRAFVMGQFSRFVRPGDVRIDVSANDSSLGISAFENLSAGTFAIVVVNNTQAAIDHTFNLQGLATATVTPWMTSATASLAAQSSVAVSNNTFGYTIPATSVITFVGAMSVPPTITTAPASHAMTAGRTVALEVAASGESLSYQWLHDGAEVSGATTPRLVIAHAQVWDAGAYSVRVTNAAGTVTSPVGSLTIVTTDNPGHLVNLSMRSYVGTGDNVPIGGFVIAGSGQRKMLIRVAGPSLAVAGAITDPILDLHSGNDVETNDSWDPSLESAFSELGAFAWDVGTKDAALLVTLPAGGHTAVVHNQAGLGEGIALVEIYDADNSTSNSLINLSGRALVRGGNEVQILGLVISGDTALTVVLRAGGPGLAAVTPALVGQTLPDPVIELHRQSDGVIIATSDNWDEALTPYFSAVGAYAWPTGSADAALMQTLEPGSYTLVVRDKNGASGIALAEVYTVP